MPAGAPELPDPFKPGDELTAESLNKIVKAIRPLIMPGQFSNGNYTLQKPKPTPKVEATPIQIRYGITEGADLPAATGNYTSGNITPGTNGSAVIREFVYGAAIGGPALRQSGTLISVENYVFGPIVNHSAVFFFTRSNGAQAIISRGCALAPAS